MNKETQKQRRRDCGGFVDAVQTCVGLASLQLSTLRRVINGVSMFVEHNSSASPAHERFLSKLDRPAVSPVVFFTFVLSTLRFEPKNSSMELTVI